MTKHHDAHQLSGVYAVDAVTPEEAAFVEAAMRDSEDLRSEVVGLVDTAVALGLSVPQASPPPALRARLLSAIEDLPQEPAEVDDDARAVTMPQGQHVVPRRRRRLTRPSVILTTMAVAALLFSGGFLLQRAVLQPQFDYAGIEAAADVEQTSRPVTGGGVARVSWSASEGRTAVVLNGVRVPEGKALQLWKVRGGSVSDAGLYTPQGDARFTLIDGTPRTGDSLAVSVEPMGGSKKPTTVIAVVPLTA